MIQAECANNFKQPVDELRQNPFTQVSRVAGEVEASTHFSGNLVNRNVSAKQKQYARGRRLDVSAWSCTFFGTDTSDGKQKKGFAERVCGMTSARFKPN